VRAERRRDIFGQALLAVTEEVDARAEAPIPAAARGFGQNFFQSLRHHAGMLGEAGSVSAREI
jgi:hypothetical protein